MSKSTVENRAYNYSVATDVGASKVSILIAEPTTSGRIRVVAGNSVFQGNGVVKRCEIRNATLLSSILESVTETIKSEDQMQVISSLFNISGTHIKCANKSESIYIKSNINGVTNDDMASFENILARIKPEYGMVTIDNSVVNYDVDGQFVTENPMGVSCDKLTCNFISIVGDDEKVHQYNRALHKSNIAVAGVIHSAQASARAILSKEEMELGVCVVDLGSSSCNIAIYKDKKLQYLTSLPYGVELINSDIKSIGILEKYIEPLKIQYGNAVADSVQQNSVVLLPSIGHSSAKEVSVRTLARVIESRMYEIIKGIKEAIVGSGFSSKLEAGIVLTGGGALLTNVDALFKKNIGCDVRIGRPNLYVDGLDIEIIDDPRYATVIGMLLLDADKNSKKCQVLNTYTLEPEDINADDDNDNEEKENDDEDRHNVSDEHYNDDRVEGIFTGFKKIFGLGKRQNKKKSVEQSLFPEDFDDDNNDDVNDDMFDDDIKSNKGKSGENTIANKLKEYTKDLFEN